VENICGDRLWIPIVVARVGSTTIREVVGRILEEIGRISQERDSWTEKKK
jgi:hypothetical protein